MANNIVFNPLFNLRPIPHDYAAGVRRFYPTPSTAKPIELYHDAVNGCSVPALRYIRINDSREVLIYMDGACSNLGTPQARAGYGVKWSPHDYLSYRLEGNGPETSDRAELRAAITALGLRAWKGEGFDKVVLACDSEYVVKGISEWVLKWKDNGWQSSRRKTVVNRDLWEMLLMTLENQDDCGVLVQFWLIAREDNQADPCAKAGTFEEKSDDMSQILAMGM